MEKQLYDYDSYKEYLNDRIKNSPSKGHGMKRVIAEAIGCQAAFVTQVLKGEPNFSLEQGVRLNSFLGHSKEESKFFMYLLHLGRAGSIELEDFFKQEIKEIRKYRSDLKNRVDTKDKLRDVDQQIYYSTWHYAAIHIMLTLPHYRTHQVIAKRLSLPENRVVEILDFLVKTGLARRVGSHYEPGRTRIHLSKDSPQIQRHHTNWRMRAIHSIDVNDEQDLHYSSVVTISEEDVAKIKELFIKSIESARKIVKESPEETLQGICIDFFRV